jgi:hypothetical protein
VVTSGYILLHRKLVEHPVWNQLEPSVLKVMLAFLLRANWKSQTWYDGQSQIEIPRGSFITSYPKMAEFCRLTLKITRTAFTHLENLHFAAYQRAPHWTMVTVLNYDSYQSPADEEGRVEGSLRAGLGQPRGQGVGQQMNKENELIQIKQEQNPCASPKNGAALVGRSPSIDNPPFETTEPDAPALFPVEESPNSRRTAPRDNGLTAQQQAWWDTWYRTYWRKRSPAAARKAFGRHVTTQEIFEQVVAATLAQTAEMLQREASKRPYPATWLNAESWRDEVDPPKKSVWDDLLNGQKR